MKTIKKSLYGYCDEERPNLVERMALEAVKHRRKSILKRQAFRMLMHLARHLPAEIPHCQLDDVYDFYLVGDIVGGLPELTFKARKTQNDDTDKLFYRKALASLRKALNIRHMKRQMSHRGDNHFPYWYYKGPADIGGVKFRVIYDLGYDVPDGCTRTQGESHREVRTVRTYTAYCAIGKR